MTDAAISVRVAASIVRKKSQTFFVLQLFGNAESKTCSSAVLVARNELSAVFLILVFFIAMK